MICKMHHLCHDTICRAGAWPDLGRESAMIRGARQLPTMHVSVRVPWHDSRWAGNICANPRGNTSCLVLPRIAETKDDDFEAGHAKADWNPDGARLPACAAERGAFMA